MVNSVKDFSSTFSPNFDYLIKKDREPMRCHLDDLKKSETNFVKFRSEVNVYLVKFKKLS